MITTEPTKTIDARGMACPGPLMALIGAIRQGQIGDVIEVCARDAGARTDLPAWVTKAKHELVAVTEEPGFAKFTVRKAR